MSIMGPEKGTYRAEECTHVTERALEVKYGT